VNIFIASLVSWHDLADTPISSDWLLSKLLETFSFFLLILQPDVHAKLERTVPAVFVMTEQLFYPDLQL